jgi:hypothetical protein
MQPPAASESISALFLQRRIRTSRDFGNSFSPADASKMTQERSRFVGSEQKQPVLEAIKLLLHCAMLNPSQSVSALRIGTL